ncbi:hypothetical protein [Streptomyces sp. NPDC002250]|uniref:hypothetical protein n=1 Tax=Streptomyces sp. NPDC002250 TaxID=3364641 RepID=UPI0036AAFEC8
MGTDAFAIGLTCGGSLDVFVQPFLPAEHPEMMGFLALAGTTNLVTVARVVRGPAEQAGQVVCVRADGTSRQQLRRSGPEGNGGMRRSLVSR